MIVRDILGDLVVSFGTHVVRDRRVSPYLGSRSATTKDDPGEQARPVNLLETWGLVSRRGQRGNPLANGQNSSWVAKLTANDWVTGRSTLSFESGLNVQSGHSEGHLRVIRAVLCGDRGH